MGDGDSRGTVVEVVVVVVGFSSGTTCYPSHWRPPLVHCAPYSRGPEWEFWTLRGLAIITALQHYGTRAIQHYNTAATLQHPSRTTILAIIALPANTGVTAAVVTDGCVGGSWVRAIYNTS